MDIEEEQLIYDNLYQQYLREIVDRVVNLHLEKKSNYEIFNIICLERTCDLFIDRTIDSNTRFGVLKRQKWKCNLCGQTLKFNKYSKWEGQITHIDHIHPYSKRNSYIKGPSFINEPENLQALCPSCNLSKGQKEVN